MHAKALGLATLLLTATVGQAVELAKIDRRIAKEPKYQTNTRGYALLVFGSTAETRVWIVREGNRLYVDRNANGDLTDAAELFVSDNFPSWSIPEIVERDGMTKHTNLRLSIRPDGTFDMLITLSCTNRQTVGLRKYERPTMGATPAEAPVIHFAGPMTFTWYGQPPEINRGDVEEELRLGIGTPGLGKGTFAAYDCWRIVEGCLIQADFRYARAGGGDPIVVQLTRPPDD